MKKIILLIAAAFIFACSGPKGMVKIESNGNEVTQAATVTEEDSVEYELIVMDPEFESWYIFQDSPARYRSQQYYESWNRQYVSAWNALAMNPGRRSFFQTIIGYEPNVDYGFKLNHKLFYYFQYVEHKLRIPILSNGPVGVVI
ncbi:MAG: DUF6146 family protein [Fermentimonas sp.]|jgi:hypothetical protein|nr:DUF6146 family protein [Fermentimonas sp.]NLC87060.1 hypothetical protein [Bacteroidales bacterium]MDD2930423.1 DUF6146 family protein [Fermentimonas sp.]MDD3188597.1 DUF6146 family protein [Fermentimonas sp.]MDD3511272.1 DUF6146 family protein [Fermentimonas sp.]